MSNNGFRSAHGKGARLGRLTASECMPFDELRPASTSASAQPDRDSTGRFVKGNRAGRARKVRVGKRGALVVLERQGDAAARAALAFGRRYAIHRRAELAKAHGEISAGVGAMVESAGELLASSRYWSARSTAEGNADYARLAATLVAGSRQAERDAWQLATLEAAARPKPVSAAAPWLAGASPSPSAVESAPQGESRSEAQPSASNGQSVVIESRMLETES